MSIRAILTTVLGIACGTFAVMGIQQMRKLPAAMPEARAEVSRILVVASTVPRGYVLQESMVELRDWPTSMVPANALDDPQQAVGRVSLTPLIQGEPLLEGKLAPLGVGRGAGNLVAPGMRAYSILAANAAASVAGLILPGDHVDVILSIQTNVNDETGGGTSTTLLQNVEILAIDQELEAPAGNVADPGLTTVTLLVTQRQASLLGLGMKAGVLSLALRNPEDGDMAETEPVTLSRLRFREEAPLQNVASKVAAAFAAAMRTPFLAARKPRVTVSTIRTLRGSHAGIINVAELEAQ
jgi:pilus assembly protein CpaB